MAGTLSTVEAAEAKKGVQPKKAEPRTKKRNTARRAVADPAPVPQARPTGRPPTTPGTPAPTPRGAAVVTVPPPAAPAEAAPTGPMTRGDALMELSRLAGEGNEAM